jgi:hypothetical protein
MRNFLIDSDTASDDAVAIMMALPGSSLPGVREIACAQGFATSVTQAGVSTLKIRMDLLAPSRGRISRRTGTSLMDGNLPFPGPAFRPNAT